MTSNLLKLIALVLMTIDHIGEFFPDLPIYFRWIGRLSAPIFLFVFVHSLSYTSNKTKLLLRLYFFNFIMCVIRIVINETPVREILFGFENNIFGTFFAIAILISLIEYVRNKGKHYKQYLTGYILLQTVSTVIVFLFILVFSVSDSIVLAWSSLTANIFFNEGRLFWVLLGVMLYYAKNNKISLAMGYTIFIYLNSTIILSAFMPRLSQHVYRWTDNDILLQIFEWIAGTLGYDTIGRGGLSPIYDHYEWMAIAALPFMLLYNGKKGKSCKWFFYIYYPAHLVLLAICCYYYYFVR